MEFDRNYSRQVEIVSPHSSARNEEVDSPLPAKIGYKTKTRAKESRSGSESFPVQIDQNYRCLFVSRCPLWQEARAHLALATVPTLDCHTRSGLDGLCALGHRGIGEPKPKTVANHIHCLLISDTSVRRFTCVARCAKANGQETGIISILQRQTPGH